MIDGGLESDQYMLGDNILFAPMFVGAKARTVRLPAGKWYEYKTGKYVGSAQTLTITPSLSDIPLYVRGGTAIPTNLGSLRAKSSKPYQLRCYGDGPFLSNLYEDDGTSFAFEKGDFLMSNLKIENGVVDSKVADGKRTKLSRKIDLVTIIP
jgi:alpha-D-xyloside xylohydrolase